MRDKPINISQRHRRWLLRWIEEIQKQSSSPWMTVKEASEYLKISKSKLYKLISGSNIPFKRIGIGQNAKILFSRRSLDLWLITGKVNGFTKQDRMKAQSWI